MARSIFSAWIELICSLGSALRTWHVFLFYQLIFGLLLQVRDACGNSVCEVWTDAGSIL